MKWERDTVIFVLNIIITVVSGIGAYKSFRYFEKSRHITIYAQTNQALNELGEMLKMLPEALAAMANPKRGFNAENAIRDFGTELCAGSVRGDGGLYAAPPHGLGRDERHG